MTRSQESREQRIIDHEVLLSRTRELVERYVTRQQGRADKREAWLENAWMRRQVADMIAGASPDELQALGLNDAMMREMRLGASLRDAWSRLHPPPPPVAGDETRSRG